MNIIKNGFKNEALGIELDVYVINEKEWFKAQDISNNLDYLQASDMLRNIDFIEENTIKHNMLSDKGNYSDTRFINEIALYECVLKIRDSKTDEIKHNRFLKAREFQKWVFSDVLPSIRKNNFYINEKQIDSSQINELEKKVKTLRIAKGILHEIVYDIADATTMSFTEASKKLFGKNAKYLKTKLKEEGFIDSDGKVLIKKAEFTKPDNSKEMLRLFTNTNVEKCREVDDIKYSKITNFGYLYLKKHFNKKGVSNFKFNCEEQ